MKVGSWSEKGGPWDKSEPGDKIGTKGKTAKSGREFAGATQALEIDHVAVEGDGTWIYTKGDHGLLLSDKGAEEFYWPSRTFAGPCGFSIATTATTHPVTLSPRCEPTVIAPLATAPAGIKPGVRVAVFSGTGTSLEAQTQISETIVSKASETGLVSLIRTLKIPGAVRIEGYLQVPADGVYTIHFGVSDEYRMRLSGVTIIEAFRGQNLMPDAHEVKLTKGCYPVSLECFKAGNERAQVWATTDWEGPGMARRDFLPSLAAP